MYLKHHADVPEVIVYSNSNAGVAEEYRLKLTSVSVDPSDCMKVCKEQVWFCGFCGIQTL